MSAEQDNKAFIADVLSNAGIDFSKATFGIWTSSFQHINFGSAINSGYSYPKPLIEDLVSANFSITGQTFNFVSLDGKSPNILFFLTSGVKGINGYESLEPVAQLNGSYVSGLKPVVVLPDMDFPGKLYRRYEVTGFVKSSFTNNNIIAVSGEDWVELPNSISANNTDQNYSYEDAGYSGYSNQTVARYKFLYNDSGKSSPQDFYEFEFPLQLERGSIVKYRVSRRSDPVGSFEIPYFTANGKVVIDYSQYKEEISGALDGKTDYIFDLVSTVSLTRSEADTIFDDGKEIIKSLTGAGNVNESVTGIRFYKTQYLDINQEQQGLLNFDLLGTGEYSEIYKASVSVNCFFLNQKTGVDAYVMTGFNLGDGNNVNVELAVGNGVYPRLIEDGSPYTSSQIANIVDIKDIVTSELLLQDLLPQSNAETEEEETSELARTIEQNFKAYAAALNDELGDESFTGGGDNSENSVPTIRSEQDQFDIGVLSSQNSQYIIQKSLLPNYPLPKKTYTSDYFSNYENSGESYVLNPLSEYSLNPSFASHGDGYDSLQYYLSEVEGQDNKIARHVVNTSAKGMYIDEQGLCNGQTAFSAPPTLFSLDGTVSLLNGKATQIPKSDGIIKKSNYYNETSWKSALNYFYEKNYVASFDVYPSFSQADYDGLFNQVFTEVKNRIKGPTQDVSDQDSFFSNQGTSGPRIFVEREIYTEDYNQFQTNEIIKSTAGNLTVITGISDGGQPEEKLYCVQSYDASEFTENIPKSFYPTQAYREVFSFDEFIPFTDLVDTSFAGSKVTQFYTGENATAGDLYFEDKNYSDRRVFRAEYVTGLASSFTYANYSNAAVWNGVNGNSISIASQDLERYSYHLFEYTGGAAMKLKRANVLNGDVASISESNATVLKFQKTPIAGKSVTFTDQNNTTYYYIKSAPTDSAGNLIPVAKLKLNIQAYKYNVTYPEQDLNWVIFNGNPINNNAYGASTSTQQSLNGQYSIPRFFQDATEDAKSEALIDLQFPNGPYTSKNYEGTPVKEENITSLKNGLFDNTITIKEDRGREFNYESNCTLDILENGILQKGQAPEAAAINDPEGNRITLDNTRRLRITKVRYNFYTKDLIIVGDAGYPESSNFNPGWEYKLQYRKSPVEAWKTMGESSAFTNDKFSSFPIVPSPYFYKYNFTNNAASPRQLSFLGIVAFRTNMPLFLDDASFEFRVAKYEKLSLSSDTVNVIKKTNMLPIGVSWTANQDCEYYNIYQKDVFQNLTLIRTLNGKGSSALALPDISQRLINLGVSGFGGLNGTGYYDIVISGIKPAVSVESESVNSTFNQAVTIGDSDNPLNANVLQNQTNYTPVAISNVTYSGIIDFNNPELRTENFVLSPKYNGFYFTSSGASVTFSDLEAGFEAYVANLGNSAISVGGSSVAVGQVAKVVDNGSVSLSTIQSNPSQTLDLSDVDQTKCLVINQAVTITNTTAISEQTAFVTNDSSSPSTITFGAGSYSLGANKTAKLKFTDPSSIVLVGSLLDNEDVQVDKIYRPDASLVNFDYGTIEFGPSSFSSLGFYNNSKDSVSLKNSAGSSVGTLQANTFNIVSWNGTAATVSQKEYFDDIKIYLRGDEPDAECRIIIKDDSEIILSYFQPSSTAAEKSYYFLKDELSNRNFNIKITNGSSEFFVPLENQDFKLTVIKSGSAISYSIIYPSENPVFEITDKKEQLVLITQYAEINTAYLKSKMKSDSFIYFMNKSSVTTLFKDESANNTIQLSQNQIAKAFIVDNNLKIEIIGNPNAGNNGAFSRLSFTVDPAVHMQSATGILDLDFCGTEIKLPPVSNFAGKELFLICRNRSIPNIIDPASVLDTNTVIQTTDDGSTLEINERGSIGNNSIALRVYKNNTSDSLPSIERIKLIQDGTSAFSRSLIPNDQPPIDESVERNFFIDDSDLNSFVLRDFYNRKVPYFGNVFLPVAKEFVLKSYDTNTTFTSALNSQSKALEFNYSPDGFANGRFTVDNSKSCNVYNDATAGANTPINSSGMVTNDIAINFTYSNVTVDSVRLNKNRLFKKDYLSDQRFGIYNTDEFFLPKTLSSARYNVSTVQNHYYYQILPSEQNVQRIIIPDSVSSNYGFVIKNWTSRTITVQQMSYDGTNFQHSLKANEQKKFTYTGSWGVSTDTSVLPESIINVSYASQKEEIDSQHPFFVFYEANGIANPTDGTLQPFLEQFIPSDINNTLTLGVTDSSNAVKSYALVDIYPSGGTIPAISSARLACFGRQAPQSDHASTQIVANNFYLYLTVGSALIRKGKFLNTQENVPKDFEIVSRKIIDLSAVFLGEDDDNNLPNTWLIPICGNLQTFCLPNLSYGPNGNPIGETLYNKSQKVIFVNTLDCPLAPNRVYNYSTDSSEDLVSLNSLVVYGITRSGSSPNYTYAWEKQTTSLPVVQTATAKLTGIRGLTRGSTSEISVAREFVYLPNVKRFELDINSFVNKEFGDILLFNSALNNLQVQSTRSNLGSYKFMKISRDSSVANSFYSIDVGTNGSSSFSVVKEYRGPDITEADINASFPKLKQDSFVKYLNTRNNVANYFIYDSKNVAKEAAVANADFAELNIERLTKNSPDRKLFVYGSAFISDSNNSFFKYDLLLSNVDKLGQDGKFYIYNNCSTHLNIKLNKNDTIFMYLPPRMMMEISQKSSSPCGIFGRDSFFVSKSRNNINYINKIGVNFRFGSLKSYDFSAPALVSTVDSEACNIAATCLVGNSDYVSYFYSDGLSTTAQAFNNRTFNYFSSKAQFRFDSEGSPSKCDILRTIIKVTSTSGHYILSSFYAALEADNPSSGFTFLVNNTAQDIIFTNASILYRNSVAVVSSDGSIRYLKKAKKRDEFYCLLNPKTAISTQREITLQAGIPRSYDVLPIEDAEGRPQQSYVKILSKNGQSTYVYIPIRSYYDGIDIPTDTPENSVGYEVGIGHETIYKFLFYNPRESMYTMPGIINGLDYLVEIDDGLYRDLKNLPGENDLTESNLLAPIVKYNGVEYANGGTFKGGENPNYEVRYPNYVKVYRVVYEVNKEYPNTESKPQDQFEGTTGTEQVAQDTKTLLIQAINSSARSNFGSPIGWTPINKEAFWSSSQSEKDPWVVEQISASDIKEFVYPPGSTTSYARFVKCKVKKLNFRSPISSYSYDFFSAFQERKEASDPRDLIISLDEELNEIRRNKIIARLNAYQSREDYILNTKNFNLGILAQSDLERTKETAEEEEGGNSDYEIKISVSKIQNLPTISFDDVSTQEIIKIINK